MFISMFIHAFKFRETLIDKPKQVPTSFVPDCPMTNVDNEQLKQVTWRNIKCENLDCRYSCIYSDKEASDIFNRLEKYTEYNKGELAKVCIFGKWHNIPRKQCAFGDDGLKYKFSGVEIPARQWTTVLQEIREKVENACNEKFNFVLINRYADGNDHMGEHRDDEFGLEKTSSIASLTFGAERDFIFKHKDTRGANKTRTDLKTLKIKLEHGSLLVMKYPTNEYWYHSLPKRKNISEPRINLTFRKMKVKK